MWAHTMKLKPYSVSKANSEKSQIFLSLELLSKLNGVIY